MPSRPSVTSRSGEAGKFRRLLGVTALALAAMGAGSAAAGPQAPPSPENRLVQVQMLGLNDFHGHLEPSTPGFMAGQRAGGAEYLGTHIDQLEASNPNNTVVVAAGDLVGASPLVSALFHDEPSVEALTEIGLDFASVGNHEFDEGSEELLRMQYGGCHPDDGCQDGDGFAGAGFQYLSANAFRDVPGDLLPAYAVKKFDGIKVGFIGLTLEGTPTIVTPSGVAGLTFSDEADMTNRIVDKLRDEEGVRAFVVLIHEGGYQSGGFNSCAGISGPIVDIVRRTTSQVDAFVTGHTHQGYNCNIEGSPEDPAASRPVTSASSFGRLVTDYDLVLDRLTRDVVSMTVNNMVVTQTVPKDEAVSKIVSKYAELSAPLRNRVIGQITADITRTQTSAGESRLGNLIADAQLAASVPSPADARVAFMNPGGIRTDLLYKQSKSEGDGNVTYEEAFAVQPFGNSLVTMTLTGTQIDRLLEEQWIGRPTSPRILQVSDGFSYTWSSSAPAGDKVDPASITLGGAPVDPSASYRVTVNSFLADGGDGFFVLRDGTGRVGGPIDLDALAEYFGLHSPVAPPATGRINTTF